MRESVTRAAGLPAAPLRRVRRAAGLWLEARSRRLALRFGLFLLLAGSAALGAEEGASGVDVRDLVLVDHAYVMSVEVYHCRGLEEFVAEQLRTVPLGWLSRLADDVVSRSSLVVVSGEVTRRSAVHQGKSGEYSVSPAERPRRDGTWLVPTDPRRGGPCSALESHEQIELLTTASWCDVTPSRDASCFFEVDYAYRPSPALLRAVEAAWQTLPEAGQ